MKIKAKQRFLIIGSFLLMIIMVISAALIYSNNVSKASKYATSLNLSDKQLLMLSSFLYLEDATNKGPIKNVLETLKTGGKYDSSKITMPASGIKDSDAIKIFKDIEKDSLLYNMVVVDSLKTDIKAVCMVPKDQVDVDKAESVLVFGGINPLKELWTDYFEGAYSTDTSFQQTGLTFHEKVSDSYTVTSVAGHSIGGNIAQYITITNGEKIEKCVSFNGQGFSKIFIEKHNNEINSNINKIKTVSSYKDPVNILLTKISNTDIIVPTDSEMRLLSSHNPTLLYNSEYFNNYGAYKPNISTKQDETIINIKKLTDNLLTSLQSKVSKDSSNSSASSMASYLAPIIYDAIANESVPFTEAVYQELDHTNYEN